MSGLIDLSGIASRAYTPGAKSNQPAQSKSESADSDRQTARQAVTDRRLAPAFSIELSLAAQKALTGKTTTADVSKANTLVPEEKQDEAALQQFSEGVGRREVPLSTKQRDVPLGSRLNIQV